ncbi:hypothetical protein ACHAW6_014636 [Cyclotella cf. meneghiniana]
MQIRIRVRPTQGYHYPNKIDELRIDSSARLETIQANYSTQTQGSTTKLYYNQYELPLNSSIGSHNFDDGAIIECCRSPAVSAALSACLKDLDAVRKLRPEDRHGRHLMDILQTPWHIRHHATHDMWQAASWTDESIKSRTINFATIKAVIQRQDRYQVHDLPQCNDAHSLYLALQAHNVWGGGASLSIKHNKSRWNQQAHIFKPLKKDGSGPTTNWILLEAKLAIIEQIKRDFRTESSSSEDYLEEFVKRDHSRHEITGLNSQNRRTTATHSAISTNDDSDTYLMYLASSPLHSVALPRNSPRRRKAASPPRSTTNETAVSMTPSITTTYIPQYASAPFAVLATLHSAMHAKHNRINGRRLLTLNEDELKRLAQPICRSNLYDKMRIRGRNAFICMDGLIEKKFVRKEIVRNPETGLEIEKWGLLADGEALGGFCAEYERAVRKVVPKGHVKAGVSGKTMNVVLCMDTREDVHYLERIKKNCDDENIPFLEKELPAGDYLFLEESLEEIVPLVIERKSWSDLADSCLGKGRANNRLDCVRLNQSVDASCGGNCQLCKMKRCGCTQILFIIEGERCQAQSHTTCTIDSCCSACKLLSERHNVTQTDLEGVLTRLQVKYGCYIHYTKSFNDTICSLFTIRTLLQRSGSFASQVFKRMNGGSTLSLELYKSNAQRHSQIGSECENAHAHLKSLHEWDVQALLPMVTNSQWDIDMVHVLLGSEKSIASRPKVDDVSSKPSKKAILLYSDSDDSVVEVVNKLDHRKQPEVISLDSDSDNDSILDMTRRKHVIQSKSDDSIIILDDEQKVPQKKRKASQILSSESFLQKHKESTSSMLILHRLGHYEAQLGRRLEEIWRKVYEGDERELNGFYDTSLKHLKNAIGSSSIPFVHSSTISAFSLWLQLIMGVQVRFVQGREVVTGIRQSLSSDDSCRGLPISTEECSMIHLPQTSSCSAVASRTRPSNSELYSTPTKSNPIVCRIVEAKHTSHQVDRKRPSSSMEDAIREARLQRFDKSYHSMESVSCPFNIDNQLPRSACWSCEQCTLENDSSSAECKACGFLYSSVYNDKPQTLPRSESWICQVCAFVNILSDNKCNGCGYQNESNSEFRPEASGKKSVRCGACGKEGHNRSTATEYNCDAYNDEKEIERREKLRQKKEAAIEQERQKIERLEREGETAEQLHREWLQKTEEMQRSNAQAKEYRNDALKRAKEKMKRLQKRNR